MRRRKAPHTEAAEHAAKELDKTAELEVQYIDSFKGRGVFSKAHFQKGDFVVEYRGELIDSEESQRRRSIYHQRCNVFMFDFYWKERTWCIDASREDGSLGRLVNDDHCTPNCKMKRIISEGKPHLFLFALREISPGEEIVYDYGGTDWPWRKTADQKATWAGPSEAELTRTTEEDAVLSPPSPNETDHRATGAGPSEAELTRTTEEDAVLSPPSPNKTDHRATGAGPSEAELTRTTEEDAVLSPPSPNKTDHRATGAGPSEAELTRTTEEDAVLSPPSPNKTDHRATGAGPSEAELTRTTEEDAVLSPPSPNKTDHRATGAGPSEAELTRTTEEDAVLSPLSPNKTRATGAGPSEAELTRTTEEDALPFPLSPNKTDQRATLAGPSEAELTRTTEEDAVLSPPSPNKTGQSTWAGHSEAELTRTTEEDGLGSPPFPNKTDQTATWAGPSEAELTRTTEEDGLGSPLSPNKILDELDAQPTEEMAPPNPSMVNFVETSLMSEASTSLFNFSKSFQTGNPKNPFSEHHLAKQDQDCVPRLRRTKSIQMNKQIHFDSDELFDPSSDGSEEEYVPKANEVDSDDSDAAVGRTKRIQRSLIFGAEVKKSNSGSSKQVRKKRHLSSKKGCSSGPRLKSHINNVSCSEAQTSSGHSSNQSGMGDTGGPSSTLDLEQNPPHSSSSSYNVANASLSISAVCKKKNGSRVYNKKQYCLYCKLGFIKMARHLERAHQDKPEVAQAVSFPKGSQKRKMHLEHLRNRGNFAHNVEVMNAGVGELVPRKKPKMDSQAQNFLHCIYCQGFFRRKVLWRHMTICKFKPDKKEPGKSHVQALCAFATPRPPGVKEEFWKLLSNMVQDEVCSAIKSDPCIMEYGEHLYNRLGYDAGKHEYIRQKLREMGRLLVGSRKITPLKTLEDHIKPTNFMHVVEAVRCVAGYDSKTHTYKCPSLALKLGHSLTKISLLVESRANVQCNYSAAKEARTFRRVYETRWNELISATSLRTLQESRWNAPLLLPFTKDVQTLHSYLDEQHQKSCSQVSTEASPETWAQLAKITLTQVILFNRRRAGEVSKMPLSAYLSKTLSDPLEDANVALSDLEKKLCQHFRRIEIRGKRGRKVPVLLTPAMQQALDLLVRKRHECGVPQGNTYLFARPHALTCYRGSDCLRHFSMVCGAKSPQSLTSTKLRKQTGTLSQVLNLSNTELDQLADFLGHDIRVHRQFYRLPEGTLQLAKISKVLMVMEQGRLAEFKGKSLDDISIDPEENVSVDSDGEVACEPDCQESPVVTSSQTEATETKVPDVNNNDVTTEEDNNDPAMEQDITTPSQVHSCLSPKRGGNRQPFKRKTWQKEEILAVERHMMSFITSCRVPGKYDCDKCLQLEKVALKNRNWLAIKFYIKNRIAALKRKV